MFKKIILTTIILLSFIGIYNISYGADCTLGGDVKTSIQSCINGSTVLTPTDLKVEGGFKELIVSYIKKVSSILAIVAVGSIAYGSMMIVISVGEDEKIKKGRNIIKWALVGFLILVSAAGLIKLVIYIVYGL